MPSLVIHLAIGKEYIRKHKIEDEKEFLKGCIAPDFEEDFIAINKDEKKYSHFTSIIDGKQTIEIQKFKNSDKVDIEKDFWKGYFLHILTDYYFYQRDFKEENEKSIKEGKFLYYDYSCLNEELIKLYNIELIENTKSYTSYENGETRYLKLDKIKDFIEKISNLDVDYILKNMKY